MKRRTGFAGMLLAALLFTACGGSGGDDSTPAPPPNPGVTPSTGVLLDSPVAGIQYRTETKTGVTNTLGQYAYLPGESVTFFIGDLTFPKIPASGVVTPADMAGSDPVLKTNILQILQTLDSDGNPDNGITIHAKAAEAFTGQSFDLAQTHFDTDVADALNAIDEGVTLVTEEKANAHFEKSLKHQIFGSWVYSEGSGKRNVLTFIDESHYIIIHEHADEENQTAGSVEYGTYAWNTDTGDFEVGVIGESDGFGGLWDEDGTNWSAVSVVNDTLSMRLTYEGEEPEVIAFSRVPTPVDALTGAYILTEDDPGSIHVLTFLSDTEYVIAHTRNAESYSGAPSQALSGEFGTYSYNGQVFQVLGASVDTDGEGGLFNAEDDSDQNQETITLTASGNLAFVDEDEGTFLFLRIASTPDTSAYLQSDLAGTWYSVGTATPNKTGSVASNSWAEAGTMTVSGNGAFTWVTTDDSDSGTLSFLDPEKGTLTDFQPNDHLGWYMNATKDVMTLVFTNTEDHELGTVTFVKAAASYAQEDLAGVWYSAGVGTPNAQGGASNYWADAGTMTIENDGAYTWTTDSESGTLSLSPEGLVSDGDPQTDVLGWYLNASKNIMTLVFNDTEDNEQGTIFFTKKAESYLQSDLAGTWHSTGAITPAEGATPGELTANYWAEAGTLIIEEEGAYVMVTTDDSDSGTLTLSDAGLITEEGNSDVLGWSLSADKTVMTLVFLNTEDHEQGIITMVKQK